MSYQLKKTTRRSRDLFHGFSENDDEVVHHLVRYSLVVHINVPLPNFPDRKFLS